MKQQVEFCFLSSEQSQQIKRVIVQANRNTFPLIVNKQQTIQEFTEQTEYLIDNCFKQQETLRQILGKPIHFCFGMKADGKLIAAILGIDIVQWYNLIKPFFGKREKYSIFQNLNVGNRTIGQTVYSTRLSVLPQMMTGKIGKRLMYECAKYLSGQGYKRSIAGSSTLISRKMGISLGGKVMRQVEVQKATFTLKASIIQNSLQEMVRQYELSN